MSSNRTTPAAVARDAIAQLERRAEQAEAALRNTSRRCNELEDRLYRSPARQIASFYRAEWEDRPDLRAHTISLLLKQMQYCLSNLNLIDSYSSMTVINEAIEKVTKAVADDLADQLRARSWEMAAGRGALLMPKLIALCGAPGSGKSEVQRILERRFNVVPVDDGMPLREFVLRNCPDFRFPHVETQAGKAGTYLFPGGRKLVMRDVLGKLGNAVEDIFGPDAIPEMAIVASSRYPTKGAAGYSFGSVRRKQGRVYKRHGGTVIEIVREGRSVINEFDRYDVEPIDITIVNNGSIEELEQAVIQTCFPIFAP